MNEKLTVYCKNIQENIEINKGDTLAEIYDSLKDRIGITPICCHVNNRTENLSYAVYAPKLVEFLDRRSAPGRRVYTRSLCMILYKAVYELAPDVRLIIQHSIAHGYYCRLQDHEGNNVARPELNRHYIMERMRRMVSADLPFVRRELPTDEVKRIYERQQLADKVALLDEARALYTVYYELDGVADYYYDAMAPSTGHIDVFDIVPFKEGFLLMGLDPENQDVPQQPVTQEKMYGAFKDYLRFNKVIKVKNVGELNRAVEKRSTGLLIDAAEVMHGKLLGRISDEIQRRRSEEGGARFVFIAGPSSSGKTTTAKRLAVQLMTNLMTPKLISIDDYFVDRERTPLDENGDYDYESLYALDLERLNSDLTRLLRGEEINLPTYSFELGKRVEKKRPLRLESDDILLIEGIHGLNPELTGSIAEKDKFKLYVSALTTLSIDDHNWIPTTDNRLLRRIVRDHKYRHTSALDTLRRWPSVRRGEERWIFPYQENADAMFNSSLIFELGVMKNYAEPLLRLVPHDQPEYAEAYRLLNFLSHFDPIPMDQIPASSVLREFLGGSVFHY